MLARLLATMGPPDPPRGVISLADEKERRGR
jgi:hypothetical protein